MEKHGLVEEPVESYVDMIRISRMGLPSLALNKVMEFLELSKQELIKLLNMSESTFRRRRKSKYLTSEESERLIELYGLINKGLEIFEEREDFLEWLKTRNRALGDVKPIDLLQSRIGINEVSDLLGRIEYGIYS